MAKPQEGEPVLFSRRKPAQSNLASCPEGDLSSWYDQIRMLDAEGYPHAFLEIHGMRFSQPSSAAYASAAMACMPM